MDHKCNKNVKYYPNSKEPRPQFKLHGAPSKIESTIFYLYMLFGVALIRLNAIGYCVFSKETLGAHFCAYFYISFFPRECVLYVFLCPPASISLDTIQ